MSQHDHTTPDVVMDKPQSYGDLLAQMTPEIYQRLLTAVELGKWESGVRLTKEQTEQCLQAIIAWDHLHLPETERVAWIDRSALQKSHRED